ncbi:putative J domain-containing protein [Venturia nashicola]|uniref:Putative J domain-containing protein n=1 Tax=Venturia nashicola TaxID=86259 RepID=A0A4Z1PN14_9PEZI|nr:putative J domain-containing protein [Venturia nashicola]TLD39328.1 putative J domain-containing protein [Venturia nashicola]
MRTITVATTLLCLFLAFVAAWTNEDYEIFQLNDAVQQDQGLNVTFYSWIGVKPSATVDQINKVYRKRSRDLHPDKARSSFIDQYAKSHDGKKPSNRQVNAYAKEASDRFARFGVVANVLRDYESRQRYNHFLKNGFPKWRGTGYYYSRFRPGLGSVLFGMFLVFGGGAHYLALYAGHRRHRDFVDRYIKRARHLAWGDNLVIPGVPDVDAISTGAETNSSNEDGQSMQWNRKQKRMAERDSRKTKKIPRGTRPVKKEGISTPVEAETTGGPGPVGAKKRVQAENGKVLIVDSVGNVFVEEVTEEGEHVELLLDLDAIEAPTFKDTAVVKLPLWAYHKTVGRFLGAKEAILAKQEDAEPDTLDEAAIDKATSVNGVDEKKKRNPKSRQR